MNELRKAKAMLLILNEEKINKTIYNVVGYDSSCDEIFILGSFKSLESAKTCLISTLLSEPYLADHVFRSNEIICSICNEQMPCELIDYYCKECKTNVCHKCYNKSDGFCWASCDAFIREDYIDKITEQADALIFFRKIFDSSNRRE